MLARILDHAKAEGERMSFLRDPQFSAREIAGASHLEAVCRKTRRYSASTKSAGPGCWRNLRAANATVAA